MIFQPWISIWCGSRLNPQTLCPSGPRVLCRSTHMLTQAAPVLAWLTYPHSSRGKQTHLHLDIVRIAQHTTEVIQNRHLCYQKPHQSNTAIRYHTPLNMSKELMWIQLFPLFAEQFYPRMQRNSIRFEGYSTFIKKYKLSLYSKVKPYQHKIIEHPRLHEWIKNSREMKMTTKDYLTWGYLTGRNPQSGR